MDLRAEAERAVARLEPGGRLAHVRKLTGGVSADVVRLDIETAAGGIRRVVLRRHRTAGFKGHADGVTTKERRVLAALHRAGLAVPEPYLPDDDAPHLLLEWIDGTTDVDAADVPAVVDQMAAFLADLHALDPAAVGLADLAPVEDPLVAVVPLLPPTQAGDRARNALGAVAPWTARTVLLHGDYWPGNVLWHEARLRAVIDWEDACLGDRLADLATARVELLCRHGAEAMDRFTDAYLGRTGAPAREALLVWELYVSAAALASMNAWGLDPDEEATRRAATEAFFARAAAELA